jgi:hypothetical protein
VSDLGDLALNAFDAVIGVIGVAVFIVVLGLPVWLLAHLALSGARKTLDREEAKDR